MQHRTNQLGKNKKIFGRPLLPEGCFVTIKNHSIKEKISKERSDDGPDIMLREGK